MAEPKPKAKAPKRAKTIYKAPKPPDESEAAVVADQAPPRKRYGPKRARARKAAPEVAAPAPTQTGLWPTPVKAKSSIRATPPRTLYYGDNLEILREHVPANSIDLVYLDPPFKSNQDYNVLFRDHSGERSAAQMHAFEDTWVWDDHSEAAFQESLAMGGDLADALIALRHILHTSDMMAYVAMMAPRLVELRRALKPGGALYLHCDPTASHYLKILLDAVLGPANFKSELIWKRSFAHSSAKRWAPVHDTLLYYTNGKSHTWNPIYQPLPQETADAWYNNVEAGTGRRFNRADLTAAGVREGDSGKRWRGIDPTAKGRHWAIPRFARDVVGNLETLAALDALDAAGRIHWPKKKGGAPMFKRYLEESKGVPAQDVIVDITMNNIDAERLGYPTQKPVALLERIIRASSNDGDVVLDPFCGCGTTIEAAERLNRGWIGIDVAYLAIDLIEKRMRHTYGERFTKHYKCAGGIPRDREGAQALFKMNPIDFQVWAVGRVDGQPNDRKSGDRGIDGRILFSLPERSKVGASIVSVKGGRQIGPACVRELIGTVKAESAEMGLLITMDKPTKGMETAANSAGIYRWPVNGKTFPKIQIMCVDELLAGSRCNMPEPLLPYVKARPRQGSQLSFDDLATSDD